MSESFFTMTPDVPLWIENQLQSAEALPLLSGLVPVLVSSIDHQLSDRDGNLIEKFVGAFLDIGWEAKDVVDAAAFRKINIHNRTIYIEPECYVRLQGKQLRVETIEVGYPHPPTKTMQVLRMS